MGLICCIPARESKSSRTTNDTLYRNIRCSPTWSVRWENRRRVAGEIEDLSHVATNGHHRTNSLGAKETPILERHNNAEEGTSENIDASISQPSHVNQMGVKFISEQLDPSCEGSFLRDGRNLPESPEHQDSSTPDVSCTAASTFSTPENEPLVSNHQIFPLNSTPSRQVHHSEGHQLFRQISDSRILGFKSPPGNYWLPCSPGPAPGLQGGSSDGWSMRTFSELVASSQKDRLSFDSERMSSSACGRISECSSILSSSPALDLRTCGACSEFLVEQGLVVAVLVCGHVYHAECLESVTQEIDKYDPTCPVCVGPRCVAKKTSRFEGGFGIKNQFSKWKPGPSSSTKHFLRKHFSFGSRWGRSIPGNDPFGKKTLPTLHITK